MMQPSPDELEAAFQKIEAACPLASSDDSHHGETIYDIIKALPEASTYHRLLEQQPHLATLLSDASNGEHLVFLPVDSAWDQAAGLAARVADEADASVLAMHISNHFIDEAYLRAMTNVPMIYEPDTSNGPQVVSVRPGEDGWTIGGSGKFTQPSMRASNGLVYCIDQVLLPAAPLLDVLREKGNYSTLLKAIAVSGFDKHLAAQRGKGGTLFAPSDQAFASLGPDALHFLTEEPEGRTYLNVLLKLHFCPEVTFFTNLFWPKNNNGDRRTSADQPRTYKGKLAMEFPSSLQAGDKTPKLTISITRYNSLITMAVNAVPVVEQDMAASDGAAQGINDVLLPGDIVGKGSQDVIDKIKIALQPFI